jgi:hypothetical protein
MYSIALVQYSTAVRVAPPAMAAVVVAAVMAGPGVTGRGSMAHVAGGDELESRLGLLAEVSRVIHLRSVAYR